MKYTCPSLICVIGTDGTGKTTHVKRLINELSFNGIRCRYTWLRFFHFTTLFLLVYCRLVGLTSYELMDGIKIGRHKFYKSKFISHVYPIMLLFDMIPIYFLRVCLPRYLGYVVVCDRFIYDTIVDLTIDVGDPKIYERFIGKCFLFLIPKNTKAILLDLDTSQIRERRPDLVWDRSLETRRAVYLQLAEIFNIIIINNDGDIDCVHESIRKLLNI